MFPALFDDRNDLLHFMNEQRIFFVKDRKNWQLPLYNIEEWTYTKDLLEASVIPRCEIL